MPVAIEIDQVKKIFGHDTIIDCLSVDIKAGEFFTLLGPSGCGKTTLLRMIMGFNSIEAGEIRVDGNRINETPVNQRNMGLVFQNYAVFPHMSVEENVAFGLKMRKMEASERQARVDDILKLVKIDHLRKRMPNQLSGGQQQRVALARAIVIHPRVLLMDEPLSNLDAKLRVDMRNVIKDIQASIGITTVYVTHDQEEALAISDRIAVMNHGVIQQLATPRHLYQRPANSFVATFIGQSNLIEARLRPTVSAYVLSFDDGYQLEINTLESGLTDQSVLVAVRPEEADVLVNYQPGEAYGVQLKKQVFLGMTSDCFVLHGENELVVVDAEGREFQREQSLGLQFKASKINVFTADGSRSLIRKEA